MEKWDAYLTNGQKIGYTLTHGQPIPDDLYHLAVDCLVQHVDNDILFVQRHLEEEAFPGFFEASAGGPVLYDEDSKQVARRELLEETRLVPVELTFSKRTVYKDDNCIMNSYLVLVNSPRDAITSQNSGTISYQRVAEEKLKVFLETHPVVPRYRLLIETLFLDD